MRNVSDLLCLQCMWRKYRDRSLGGMHTELLRGLPGLLPRQRDSHRDRAIIDSRVRMDPCHRPRAMARGDLRELTQLRARTAAFS